MFTNVQNRHHFRGDLIATSNLVGEGIATMDFLENQSARRVGSKRITDGYIQRTDNAVDQTIANAIRDATQTADPALQQEAAAWLWICCPDIAEQVELPEPRFDTISALAAAYVTGDAGAATWLT